jgi:hypothetical protein
MTHSQMITTRRRKEKGKKRLARVAKQAKKLGKRDVKAAGADTLNVDPL